MIRSENAANEKTVANWGFTTRCKKLCYQTSNTLPHQFYPNKSNIFTWHVLR